MELRIKELCYEHGITLAELANQLHVTYQALFQTLNGNPTLKKLQAIADILGVDIPDLFARTSTHLSCPHCGRTITITIK